MAKKVPPLRGPQLEIAGDLSVAFVNTAGARDDNRQQGVGSYADLLVWSQQTGVLSEIEIERLGGRAAEQTADAQAAFARADRLRSSLFRLYLAVSSEEELPDDDLGTVNAALAVALPALRLVADDSGVTVAWAGDEDTLDRVLWPVLFSAQELLRSLEGRPHVRKCAAEACTLFFVDRSPSRRKRWCEMKTCGSRTKALRYYHKTGKHQQPRNWLYPR